MLAIFVEIVVRLFSMFVATYKKNIKQKVNSYPTKRNSRQDPDHGYVLFAEAGYLQLASSLFWPVSVQ